MACGVKDDVWGGVSSLQDEMEEADLQKPKRFERWIPKFTLNSVVRAPSMLKLEKGLAPRCVGCGKIPPPNFLTCASGHMNCVECGYFRKVCKFISPDELKMPCLNPLRQLPCFVYTTMFNGSTIKCGACQDEYIGRNILFHSRKCSGGKNFTCPSWNCKKLGRFEMEHVMDHIIEQHYFHSYCGTQWLLTPENWWWIDRNVPRIVLMLGCSDNVWIGVSIRRRIEGEDSCIFALFSTISAKGRGAGGSSSFRAKMSFRLENCRRTDWQGFLPCLTEDLDQVLAANRCLVIGGVKPEEILNLEIELTEILDDDPTRLPTLMWKNPMK
ncbi:unnamed protein product [Orchesella dallaii]|uniref:GATA-type domain-containing protein n=1 Tax=Orchesella dallaii TaxID=48710 RepID=A0ABP1PPC4_9HEXA